MKKQLSNKTELDKQLDKIGSLLTTPVFPINIEVGSKYTVKEAVSSMDTWHMMKIVNKFLDQTSKSNVHVEVSNIGKTLPPMDAELPYIVIESSAKGILRAKRNLGKRKYVTLLEDDYNESDELAMMVISIVS